MVPVTPKSNGVARRDDGPHVLAFVMRLRESVAEWGFGRKSRGRWSRRSFLDSKRPK
jgi:hypothetical protein